MDTLQIHALYFHVQPVRRRVEHDVYKSVRECSSVG